MPFTSNSLQCAVKRLSENPEDQAIARPGFGVDRDVVTERGKIDVGGTDQGINQHSAWWYLSFAGENCWLGACFVRAVDSVEAVKRAHAVGANPGGEVSTWGPLDVDISSEYTDRLLTLAEAEVARADPIDPI